MVNTGNIYIQGIGILCGMKTSGTQVVSHTSHCKVSGLRDSYGKLNYEKFQNFHF